MKIFCFANLRQIHETASKLSFHLFTVRSQLFVSFPKLHYFAQKLPNSTKSALISPYFG